MADDELIFTRRTLFDFDVQYNDPDTGDGIPLDDYLIIADIRDRYTGAIVLRLRSDVTDATKARIIKQVAVGKMKFVFPTESTADIPVRKYNFDIALVDEDDEVTRPFDVRDFTFTDYNTDPTEADPA